MYLLYEFHTDSDGNLLATDMMLSSGFPGRTFIRFKDPIETGLFETCKKVFKDVHTKERTIDMDTYIWSFFGDAGKQVYERLKAMPLEQIGMVYERVENLAAQRASGSIAKQTVFTNPKDFFYQSEAPASSGPSLEEVEKKLKNLLGTEDLDTPGLKKVYFKAAMRLHPDRNNGDSSGMTELNYYWQEWQKLSPGVKV